MAEQLLTITTNAAQVAQALLDKLVKYLEDQGRVFAVPGPLDRKKQLYDSYLCTAGCHNDVAASIKAIWCAAALDAVQASIGIAPGKPYLARITCYSKDTYVEFGGRWFKQTRRISSANSILTTGSSTGSDTPRSRVRPSTRNSSIG